MAKSDDHRVVIGVDPHKASWTAAAVDGQLQPLAATRVPVSRDGYRALRRFARRWPNACWAIEGATGLGAPLTERLRAEQITVIDVPAKLAARVRLLSTGHGRKNDDADALSVGVAALTSRTLNSAEIDAATSALRSIVEHRDDLVKIRTQTVNRLHVVLTRLVPAGAGRELTADQAAELLRSVRPRDIAAKTLRTLAVDLISEVRHLDRRIKKAANDIEAAVTASGTTLTQLHGVGALTAGQDPRPGREYHSVPLSSRLRQLHRHGSHRGVIRRRDPPPPLPRRRSPAQLVPSRHGADPNPAEHPRQGLLPEETIRGQRPQRSDALPEKTPVRQRLSTTRPLHNPHSGGPGRTPGDDSEILRGQLKPHTPALRTSHFPDPPTATLQLHHSEPLDTERRHSGGRYRHVRSPQISVTSGK